MSTIVIKGSETENDLAVSVYDIAKNIETHQIAELLSDYLNSMNSPITRGMLIGEVFTIQHRTLQNSFMNFILAMIRSYARNYTGLTDARNEKAVQNARKIEDMFTNEEIQYGDFI